MKATHRIALLSLVTLTTLSSFAFSSHLVLAQEEDETYALTTEDEEAAAAMVEERELRMVDPGSPTPRLGFHGRIVSNGLRVDRVDDGSLAFDVGLERGDVIMKVNGRRITSMSAYRRALLEAVEYRDGRVNLTVENVRWHTGESSQRYLNRAVYLPVPASGFGGGFGG